MGADVDISHVLCGRGSGAAHSNAHGRAAQPSHADIKPAPGVGPIGRLLWAVPAIHGDMGRRFACRLVLIYRRSSVTHLSAPPQAPACCCRGQAARGVRMHRYAYVRSSGSRPTGTQHACDIDISVHPSCSRPSSSFQLRPSQRDRKSI